MNRCQVRKEQTCVFERIPKCQKQSVKYARKNKDIHQMSRAPILHSQTEKRFSVVDDLFELIKFHIAKESFKICWKS